MLHIIIGTNIKNRIDKRNKLLEKRTGDIIVLDDMSSDFAGLEKYAFPSLFSVGVPVVHAKDLLGEFSEQLTKELLVTLVNSPTFFILEERALGSNIIKTLEKSGVLVHQEALVKTKSPQTNIFAVTNAVTAKSKKDRWLAYRMALNEHSVEAIAGVLYWKLRSLIEASPKNQIFKNTYTLFMKAQKNSWQKGFSLELAIERAILEQE